MYPWQIGEIRWLVSSRNLGMSGFLALLISHTYNAFDAKLNLPEGVDPMPTNRILAFDQDFDPWKKHRQFQSGTQSSGGWNMSISKGCDDISYANLSSILEGNFGTTDMANH